MSIMFSCSSPPRPPNLLEATISCSTTIDKLCLVLNFIHMQYICHLLFVSGFICSSQCFGDSSLLLTISVIVFLLQSSLPLFEYAMICLSFLLLMDIEGFLRFFYQLFNFMNRATKNTFVQFFLWTCIYLSWENRNEIARL